LIIRAGEDDRITGDDIRAADAGSGSGLAKTNRSYKEKDAQKMIPHVLWFDKLMISIPQRSCPSILKKVNSM
jgi:hypothetical protein